MAIIARFSAQKDGKTVILNVNTRTMATDLRDTDGNPLNLTSVFLPMKTVFVGQIPRIAHFEYLKAVDSPTPLDQLHLISGLTWCCMEPAISDDTEGYYQS